MKLEGQFFLLEVVFVILSDMGFIYIYILYFLFCKHFFEPSKSPSDSI